MGLNFPLCERLKIEVASMSELAYCPECRKRVLFDVREGLRSTLLDGVAYEYPAKQAFCRECGAEAVYDPFREEAGFAFNDAVRKANGLVSLAKIRELPKRYNIGKRPLSSLLGWGEITYTRLMAGQAPSKPHSDLVERLFDDPSAYYRVLVKGKDRITETAYRKSERAVQALLDDEFPAATRIYEVADYFCTLSEGDITPMMVQKLTYYAQGFSYVLLDAPLFEQQPKAWAAGPVYGQLWHELKGRDLESEYAHAHGSLEGASPFSADEERLLEDVYAAFGRYSATMLSRMTHGEPPWVNARERAGVEAGATCREPLSVQDMKRFFGEVAEKFDIKNSKAIARYAEAAFSAPSTAGC